MSRPTSETSPQLSAKLFDIASRSRRIHSFEEVIVPERPEPIASERLFRDDGATGRRILELGSGWGEFLIGWLRDHPQDQYVAFEIKSDRIKKTVKRLRRLRDESGQMIHARIVPVNFSWFLESILPGQAFDWIIVNFPDPWPKRRHWKHRLVQSDFPARLASLLRPDGDGIVHLATDYGPYARRMLRIFRDSPLFEPVYAFPNYLRSRPADVPPTRFETITMEHEGRTPYYLRFKMKNVPRKNMRE